MGRKQNDVFVLGDESLAAEPSATREPDPLALMDAQMPDGESSSPPAPARPTEHPGGSGPSVTRRLAVLGLGAAAAATLGALELSGAGPVHPQHDQTSSRSPLAASPVASAPAPAARPARARPFAPKPRPRHRELMRRPRHLHHREPEREPSPEQAPVSSPVEAPAPPPLTVASPTPVPPQPSPPPPSGGGGPVAREFGFER
ncbi:MAG: hypothetical protein WB507_07380 [Solirubrobacterales bacterium]